MIVFTVTHWTTCQHVLLGKCAYTLTRLTASDTLSGFIFAEYPIILDWLLGKERRNMEGQALILLCHSSSRWRRLIPYSRASHDLLTYCGLQWSPGCFHVLPTSPTPLFTSVPPFPVKFIFSDDPFSTSVFFFSLFIYPTINSFSILLSPFLTFVFLFL